MRSSPGAYRDADGVERDPIDHLARQFRIRQIHGYGRDVPWSTATRPQSAEFGEAEMREWFVPGGLLGIEGERLVGNLTLEATITLVPTELNDAPPATRILS